MKNKDVNGGRNLPLPASAAKAAEVPHLDGRDVWVQQAWHARIAIPNNNPVCDLRGYLPSWL